MTINSLRTIAAILVCTVILNTGTAAAQDSKAYLIPPGPLDGALSAFSSISGIRLIYDSALTDGRNTSGISGELSPDAALGLLLAGTGLSHDIDGRSAAIFETSPPQGNEGVILLDQILVQGELQTRTLQDTQTSVAVITGEELENRSDVDLEQIAERTPGISTSGTETDFVIRGIDGRGADGFGGAPLVTTTIDGARVSNFARRTTTFFSTWDLEQIEVLRGPQSTQTGRNALAGAVVVRSRDPDYVQEFKLRGGAGNGETFEGAMAANIPLIGDQLALRITADIDRSDGFNDNATLGTSDADGAERTTARVGLRFDPTDDLSAVLKLSYFDAENAFGEIDRAAFPDRRVSFSNVQDLAETRNVAANLRLGYDVSDSFRLESETTYFEVDTDQLIDSDDSALDFGFFDVANEGESFEQEVKLIYDSDRLTGVVGGFYTRVVETDSSLGIVPASFISPMAPSGATITGTVFDDRETTNFAFFGEAQYQVLPKVSLVFGGRYDRETFDGTNVNSFSTANPALAPFLPAPTSTTTSSTSDAFLPKAGIVYDLTDDLSVGFTYQRGFRSGGATTNFFTGEQGTFDPEFTNNYEVALRSEWLDGQLVVNANAFYTGWRDQQVSVPGPSGIDLDSMIENAGSSRVWGGEIEVRAQPVEGLELFAGLGYAKTEFLDFISNGAQLAGNEFVNAPKLTASLGGVYRFEEGWFFGADASFTGDAFSDVQNTASLQTDSRFLVNLRAGYEAANWSVFAFADNAFDNDYIVDVNAGAGPLGTGSVVAGDPLTFGVIGQISF